eukprot:TRINITY_DN5835_c1_g1_i5.p1 TRINITY_DN5835_c1_g1~~TRINITY_DN5835_c1_g1_i5.p1  ORF type:complete len:532 (+),score=81.93 TRINITY_DN5835_c1_g1_i5:63-1598(+)
MAYVPPGQRAEWSSSEAPAAEGPPERSGYGRRSADAAEAPAAEGPPERSGYGRRSADAAEAPAAEGPLERSGFGQRSADAAEAPAAEGPLERSGFGQRSADAAEAPAAEGPPEGSGFEQRSGDAAVCAPGVRGFGQGAADAAEPPECAAAAATTSRKHVLKIRLVGVPGAEMRRGQHWPEWKPMQRVSEARWYFFDVAVVRGTHNVLKSTETLKRVRAEVGPACLLIVWSPEAEDDPRLMDVLYMQYQQGCPSMVTASARDLALVLHKVHQQKIARARPGKRNCECPWCGLSRCHADDLYDHVMLHHSASRPTRGNCPVCRSIPVEKQHLTYMHMHLAHGPGGRKPGGYQKTGVYTYVAARRRDGRFLLVRETGGRGWFVPAGVVEPGEHLEAAALREALEETGVRLRLTGVLRIAAGGSEQLCSQGCWDAQAGVDQITYSAVPEDDCAPKSWPDFESLGAYWVRPEDISGLHLRFKPATRVIDLLSSGALPRPLRLPGCLALCSDQVQRE